MAGTPASSRGATQPHTHELVYTSPAQSIGNAAAADLAWNDSDGPDSLLNLTVPALPTIKATGIYAFTVSIFGNDQTVGGYFVASLELDVAGEDYAQQLQSNVKADGLTMVALCATLYMTAGMQVKATVLNFDGVAARTFQLGPALIQTVG